MLFLKTYFPSPDISIASPYDKLRRLAVILFFPKASMTIH